MTIKTSPYRQMNVTNDLTTYDPINYPVRPVFEQGVAIPPRQRRCNINIAEAHRLADETPRIAATFIRRNS